MYWYIFSTEYGSFLLPNSSHNSLDNSSVSLSDVYYADFTSAFKKIIASDYVKEYPDVLDALGNPTLHIDVSGKAGPLTWKAEGVSGDLTLTISGKGKMPDYNSFSMPWYNGRDEITKIVIEDGVEYIGNYAFYLWREKMGWEGKEQDSPFSCFLE